MNRNLILGFLGGLTFAASLLVGILVADAATDQGDGEVRLPTALGDPINLATPTPGFDIEAAADEDATGIGLDRGGQQLLATGFDQTATETGGTSSGRPPVDGAAPADTTELTVAPLRPDPFDTPEIDPRFEGMFTGDVFFDFLEFPPFRFIDLCADDGGPGCPFGIGGTVLAPLDGGLDALGDFRLGANLGNAAARGAACFGDDDGSIDSTDHEVFVWASHPADFHVTYYPGDNRDARTVLAFGNTAADDPEFLRFVDDAANGRLASSEWPRGCFVLTERPGTATIYTVEVEATGITGSSASRTYSYDVTAGPRPPVVVVPQNDTDMQVLIPVKRATQAATVSIVRQSDPTTCAELEDGGRFGEVLPGDESAILFDWGNRSAYGEASDSWPYDRDYDGQRVINVVGLDGGPYLMCIWWLESPERSFDDSVVAERERRWITTPNHLTGTVKLIAVTNNVRGEEIAAHSFTVGFSCAGEDNSITLPGIDLRWAEGTRPFNVLCDYGGRRIQTPTIGRYTTPRGFRHEFALALDPDTPGGVQNFEVDLTTAGLSFDEPGPTLLFEAAYRDGFAGGTDRWQTGTPLVFEPPIEEPEALPAEIQIDTFASGVEPFDTQGIQVRAEFDRPVTLRASLLGDPCLTGPEPGFDSTLSSPGAFDRTHVFGLNGLCLLTRYSVMLEVEDEDGNTASFADVAPGLPGHPGARYFRGTGWTDGYDLSYTVRTLERVPLDRSDIMRFEVTVEGDRIDLRRPDRCFRRVLEVPTSSGSVVVGDEVTVTLDIVASSEHSGGSGCSSTERGRSRPFHASVTATIPIEDFEAGEVTIPITIESPLSEGGGPFWDTGIAIVAAVTR